MHNTFSQTVEDSAVFSIMRMVLLVTPWVGSSLERPLNLGWFADEHTDIRVESSLILLAGRQNQRPHTAQRPQVSRIVATLYSSIYNRSGQHACAGRSFLQAPE